MVSMLSYNDWCFVCGQTCPFGCHHPNAQCYSFHEFGHFAQDCPNKNPPSGTPCHQDRSCSRPWYTHTKRDRTHPPTMGTDMGDISSDQNHTAIPTVKRAAAFMEGTHCFPHPTTTVAHTTFWPMDAPITTCAVTHPTSIVATHLEHTTSPTNITHTTIAQTVASLAPATLTATAWRPQPMKKSKPHPMPSTPHKSHHSRTVIIQDSPSDSSSNSDNNSDSVKY